MSRLKTLPTPLGPRLAPMLLAAAFAFGGGHSRADSSQPPAWDPSVPLPKFITHFVIDPKFVVAISKYRSNAGHPYSDDYEEYDRSMKNYYQPLPQYLFGQNGQNTLPEYAPTNGTISALTPDGPLSTGEPRGNQLSIVPDGYPSFAVTLFHCDSLPNMVVGSHVNAGDLVGYADMREAINIDVAVSTYWNLKPVFVSPGVYPAQGQVLSPPGWRLLSPFDVMTDAAFAVYAPYGLTDRTQAIVPLAFRDANPAQFAQWDPANLDPFEAIIFPVAPVVASESLSTYLPLGGSALFWVSAAIAGTLPTYQWFKDGVAIPGATNSYLQVTANQASDAGYYYAVLTSPGGSTLAPSSLLTIQSPNNPYSGIPEVSRLVNLSVRAQVSSGEPLTMGFVMAGPGAKQLLLRAVGPSLSGFGVSGALPDPSFKVIPAGGSAAVLSGSKWTETSALDSMMASVGAFQLASGSADSAIAATLPAGGYTMSVSPANASFSGVALAEIYDADADPLNAPVRLTNLSTLAYSSPGGSGISAGFAITGPSEKQVLIRAVGPGLAQFGVATPMARPQLLVTPQGASTPPIFSDNWSGNSQTVNLQSDFAIAGAFPLTVGSNDAAEDLYLPPGTYTVQVVSGDGTAGNVLLEIYDLDPLSN
jgi:hypothetical protein